jgi:hypothetical protein
VRDTRRQGQLVGGTNKKHEVTYKYDCSAPDPELQVCFFLQRQLQVLCHSVLSIVIWLPVKLLKTCGVVCVCVCFVAQICRCSQQNIFFLVGFGQRQTVNSFRPVVGILLLL